MSRNFELIKKSTYKYVYLYKHDGLLKWWAIIPRERFNKPFDTEREAAIAIDIKMVSIGRNPVNILKPKSIT